MATIDEEDRIDDEINENATQQHRIIGNKRRGNNFKERGKEGQKLDRIVKSGYSKCQESNGFPNYFIAQKVRAKISTADEQSGNKLILGEGISQKKGLVTTKAGVDQE